MNGFANNKESKPRNIVFLVFLLGALCTGLFFVARCSLRIVSHGLSFLPDTPRGEDMISLRREGEFQIRFSAYHAGIQFGGTLNEIMIHNLSDEEIVVESVALESRFRGEDVIEPGSPKIILGTSVFAKSPTDRMVIHSGETLCFAFPTKRIWWFAEGDKLNIHVRIAIRLGRERYEKSAEFTRTLTKREVNLPAS